VIVGEAKKKTKAEIGPEGVVARIVTAANEAVSAAGLRLKNVTAVGIGAPSPASPETGIVFNAPNMAGWIDVPLGEMLGQKLALPVVVDNDVNLGTLGEFVLGAGKGCSNMVGVFVGTGVGGGLILDGQLVRGARYAAGEVGHTVIVPDGPLCGCGKRGCVEAFASRTAIEREVRAALAEGRPSVLADLMRDDNDRLTSGTIKQALDQNDALMTEVMAQVQYYLGLLAGNLVNIIDPEMIVFGGGVIEALGDGFLEPIRAIARPCFLSQRDVDRIRIVPATLGDHAVVLGAAVLARTQG
jgi:glucokinase